MIILVVTSNRSQSISTLIRGGDQQGDPLGPLLFCASSLKLARSMSSEFNLWYLDDGSVGGNVDSLLHDLETVKRVGLIIGLELNENKCEIVTDDDSVAANVRVVLPNIRHSISM